MNKHQNRLSFVAKTPLAFMLAVGLFMAACGNGDADATAGTENNADATTAAAGGDSANSAPGDAATSEATQNNVALGDMALGPADAPVTIIEYASLTCSHCASFHKTTFKRLKDNFIDTGRIRFVFRDFPLDQFAMEAAILARCGGEEKYFDIAGTLLDTQNDWAFRGSPAAIRRGLNNVAEQYGISQAQYDACLADETLRSRITARMSQGQSRFGVSSTPTIIINNEVWEGSRAYTEIAKHLIDILPPRESAGQ